jgi:hypothetical protein
MQLIAVRDESERKKMNRTIEVVQNQLERTREKNNVIEKIQGIYSGWS